MKCPWCDYIGSRDAILFHADTMHIDEADRWKIINHKAVEFLHGESS